ncbi:hypothetical protein GMSM_39500 [Geomonas sp. Red276]
MKQLLFALLTLFILAGCGVDWFPQNTTTASSLAVSTSTLPAGTVGTAYSQTLTATGGTSPYSWSIPTGTLPAGLNLSSGVISGTPTTAGTSTFTVQVTDSSTPAQTASKSLSIQVN